MNPETKAALAAVFAYVAGIVVTETSFSDWWYWAGMVFPFTSGWLLADVRAALRKRNP